VVKYFLITAIVLVAAVCVWWRHINQCLLTLTNKSGHEVTNIVVHLSGPSVQIDRLANGQSKTVRLYPQGESGLSISFLGENSKPVNGGGAYIEPHMYHVRWEIRPGDSVADPNLEAWRKRNPGIAEFITDPDGFNGKDVKVVGFVHLDKPPLHEEWSDSVCPNDKTKSGSCLNLMLPDNYPDRKSFKDEYCVVQGKFRKSRGHMGMWGGTISEVKLECH
jgi:hypothetical protein